MDKQQKGGAEGGRNEGRHHGGGQGRGQGGGRGKGPSGGNRGGHRGGNRGGAGVSGNSAESRPDNRPDRARLGALRLLEAVEEGATLDEAAVRVERFAPADRARARRLALETLRRVARIEPVLDKHLARRPRPDVLMLLRLATVELLALGEAPHGVVNAAVALARGMGPKGVAAAGMVNAVLRKVANDRDAWEALAPQEMPDWLREPVVAAWGEEVARRIEAAHEAGAPLDLTAKPALTAPGEALPTGSFRQPSGSRVTTLPGFAEGDWWVQDAAAAIAAKVLAPKAGEKIADLCAAPGGKTMQLAAAGAEVVALDISEARIERMAENLARCGLKAKMVTGDALEFGAGQSFDAVLLDAPCSATGTIRRHPDLPLIRDGSGLDEITALQAAMLDHALTLLAPQGRLVYATCSLLPAEGEDQIAALLARNPRVRVERPDVAGIDPDWITADGCLRLRPDYWPESGGMDGFFIACLRISADAT